MAHDVFISYSNKDKVIADALCHAIEQEGIRCWIAPRDVNPGQNFASEINKAIKACEYFILVFSENSNMAQHVNSEINLAFSSQETILSVKIDNAIMNESLEYYLGGKHWIDALPPPADKHFTTIIDSLKKYMASTLEETKNPEFEEKKSVNEVDKPVKMRKRLKVKKIIPCIIACLFLVIGSFVLYNNTKGKMEDNKNSESIKSFTQQEIATNTNEDSPYKRDDITLINIGDYISLGMYYDEPILWRCVDIDENGPLMLSDKILTIKQFDAYGNHRYLDGTAQEEYGSKRTNFGSDLWETSSIRSWLNSTAAEGKVKWLDGCPPTHDKVADGYNAYDAESGFLSDGNFTADERKTIKNVTQKSLLSKYHVNKLNEGGTATHLYNVNIETVEQNYSNSYYHDVTDQIFLLDVKQLNRMFQNREKLGLDYFMGKPTQICVEKSELKSEELSVDKFWFYELRTPYEDSVVPWGMGLSVRCVNNIVDYNQQVEFGGAGSFISGIRPAFYLNLTSDIFKAGNGSEINPYSVI